MATEQRLDKKIFFVPVLAGILLFNVALRHKTFFIPHFVGDQRSYVGLAMKLDQAGLNGYDLKRIGIEWNGDRSVATFFYPSADAKGDVLRLFEENGINFYNQPLFHNPPVLAYLLAISHRIFSPGSEYQAVAKPLMRGEKKKYFEVQFFSTVIPLASSLLVALLTFLLGRVLFDNATGLLASFLVTISPASLLTSHRIWADETLTAFSTLTAVLAYLVFEQRRGLLAIGCGVSLALALLTKTSALIFTIPLIYLAWFAPLSQEEGQVLRRGKLPTILLIISTVVLLALPWFYRMVNVYHVPFYFPEQPGISQTSLFFKMLNSRPWFTFIADIPFQMPLYFLGYAGVVKVFLKRKSCDKKEIFLAVWFLSYLICLTYIVQRTEMLGPENRYMLPAYPALALLSARMALRIRERLVSRVKNIDAVMWTLFALFTIWAMLIGLSAALGYNIPDVIFPF